MKKYIRLVLLLCICLLGGCGKEEKGPLEFLEEFTQEELDEYLLGRTRANIREEFGPTFDDEYYNERDYDRWHVDEVDRIILFIEYDEKDVAIRCEVYCNKDGIEKIPDEAIIFALLVVASFIALFAVGIPLLFTWNSYLGEKANVFAILGVISVVLLLPLPAVSTPLMLLCFVAILYFGMSIFLLLWDIRKNGFGEDNKATIKILAVLIVLLAIKAIVFMVKFLLL